MSLHSGAGAHPDVPVEVCAAKIENLKKKSYCFVGFSRIISNGMTIE